MMTRHEKRLAEVLLDAIGGLEGEQAVEPRCEAMHVTADEFCCSYEKVRSYYYNTYKS